MNDYKEIIVKEYHNEKGLVTRREIGEEVVRCKDCKYRYLSGVGKQHYVCDFVDAELKDNGYCSYGVRKDGEEE